MEKRKELSVAVLELLSNILGDTTVNHQYSVRDMKDWLL